MKRRLPNVPAALSALVCVAVAVYWVRSYHGCDVLVLPRRVGDRVCVSSEFGIVVFEVEGRLAGTPQPGWEYFPTPLPRRWPLNRPAAGFDAYQGLVTHYVRLPSTTLYGFTLPHWFLLLLAAVLPAQHVVRARRRTLATRRAESGLCSRCGYDLRATPGRCPECGEEGRPLQLPAIGGEPKILG